MTIFDKDGNIDDHRRPGARRGKNWESYYVFRELIWKAIDEDDKEFSIVETAKALGLYSGSSKKSR
jgi:hypothetical protein